MSGVFDRVLDRLNQSEAPRRDLEAYLRRPPTAAELVLADLPVRFDLGDDDIDYDVLNGKNG
jgi:hypothetical protein